MSANYTLTLTFTEANVRGSVDVIDTIFESHGLTKDEMAEVDLGINSEGQRYIAITVERSV